jgi:hypothetical protein
MIYNIESLYLKLKTMVLKGLLRLEMSILIPFVRLCSFWSTSTSLLHHPIPRGGNSGKNPDPAMLEFSSPAIPGVPEPSQKSPDL